MLGKHSGSRGVKDAYAKLGLTLSDSEARSILDQIRAYSMVAKHSPGMDELTRFYLERAICTVARS